jgi:AcrR family transcriptional regulator
LSLNKKVERGQATRQHLVDKATVLFTEQGFEGTSIEAVLLKSGVSRGALYHHFDTKDALFEAVLEAVEAEIAAATVAASRGIEDPVKALQVGADAFLKLARTAKVRQIVLVDAPAVLGWQKWREIDARHGFGLLRAGLEAAAAQGRIAKDLAEPFAHILLASLFEFALMVARADDAGTTLKAARGALRELVERLFARRD